jgi:Tat protein secretion system quality control protein TatD with DNase activity
MSRTELDREMFSRELDSFVPPRIFDAHCHLYRASFFSGNVPQLVAEFPEMGFAEYLKIIEDITPGRETHGLFFGWPEVGVDIVANNRYVVDQVRNDQQSRAHMLTTPTMDPEFIRESVRKDGFVGLKCYHVYSPDACTYDSQIPTYLPEEHVRVAHEEGLSITLHMVRRRAMADPGNQEVLRTWGKKYPNARFILAHAARGFNPYHTIEGISSLRGLSNMWCDTSAVTDAGAFEAIIRELGVDRLLYGGDAPVTHLRGRCVAVGDSFHWLTESNTDFSAAYGDFSPALIGLESLRTLKLACWNLGLTDAQVEKIFWGNAAELYKLN